MVDNEEKKTMTWPEAFAVVGTMLVMFLSFYVWCKTK
jgi:hypothetical protein